MIFLKAGKASGWISALQENHHCCKAIITIQSLPPKTDSLSHNLQAWGCEIKWDNATQEESMQRIL